MLASSCMLKLNGEKHNVWFSPTTFTNQVMRINIQRLQRYRINNCPDRNQFSTFFPNICWGWTNIYHWKVHFCATNTRKHQRHHFLGAYCAVTKVFEFWMFVSAEIHTHLLPRGTNDLQKENEDLDDVDVEGKSSKDILIFGDGVLPVPYQKLCVVGQELHSRNIWVNNGLCRTTCVCRGSNTHQSEDDGSQSCVKHMKPQNLQQDKNSEDVVSGMRRLPQQER